VPLRIPARSEEKYASSDSHDIVEAKNAGEEQLGEKKPNDKSESNHNEGKDEKIKIYRKRITQMQSKIETLKEVINSIVKQIGESKTKETSSKAPLD
jgi:hypothetical protein